MAAIHTVDGVSPRVRYTLYSVYALGGTVIIGVARCLIAIGYVISNYVCQKLAEHHKNKGNLKNSGYFDPKDYKGRINAWATQGLRALKEITWIGGLYLTAKEATHFAPCIISIRNPSSLVQKRSVSTFDHMNVQELLASEGFYKFWGMKAPKHIS